MSDGDSIVGGVCFGWCNHRRQVPLDQSMPTSPASRLSVAAAEAEGDELSATPGSTAKGEFGLSAPLRIGYGRALLAAGADLLRWKSVGADLKALSEPGFRCQAPDDTGLPGNAPWTICGGRKVACGAGQRLPTRRPLAAQRLLASAGLSARRHRW